MTEHTPASRKWMFLAGALLVALVALLLIIMTGNRHNEVKSQRQTLQAVAKAGPHVPVVLAGRSAPERSVTLSGEAHPYATVTIYAKVSGYLRDIRVDKGDQVGRGQLLAVIESPELDRQYDAALADAHSKRLFADREKPLLKDGVIAQQDYDNAEAAARTAEVMTASLQSQKEYELIRAPFSGRITARFVDQGALLQSATTNQTAAQPVVILSQTERLRVYVYLDQKNAALVKVGDRGMITDSARPDVRVEARVSRISGELDTKSRTLLVELDMDNRAGQFLAGGYVQVTLTLKSPPYVQVPVESVFQKGDTSYVGMVGNDNRVAFRPVRVVDSDGKMMLIDKGLTAGARVVLNPGTGIGEGQVIQPVAAEGR